MKTVKVILSLLLFQFAVLSAALAAITHDATTTGTATALNTITVNHTVGGGCTNPIIITSVAWQLAPVGTISSLTIGGSAGTNIDGQTYNGTDHRIELWKRKGVSTGSNSVVANFSGTPNSITMRVSSYCGVDQTTETGTAAKATQTTDPVTVTASSASGELVVDAAAIGGSAIQTLTVGAGQTQRANFFQDQTNHVHAGSEEAGGASVVMSWTIGDVGAEWAIIAVPLKPAAAATGAEFTSVMVQ
jgi:hypothetical protein